MPLARIFSRSPEHATTLAQELERYGYEVEVLHPEQASIRPADLEIEYELCETAEALERAQQMASAVHADIAVEPGAVIFFPAQPVSAPAVEQRQQESHVEEREEELQEVAFSQAPEQVVPTLQSVEQPLYEETAMQPNPIEPPAFEPQEKEDFEVVHEDGAISPWAGRLNLVFAASASGLEKLRDFAIAALHRIREQREHVALQSAEARARREQELLELTCRRAEAERRSQQMEAARRAAAEYLLELRKDAAGRQPATSAGRSVKSFVRGKYSNLREVASQNVKGIAAGAAAAGALFALTLGISTFRSRPNAPKTTAPAAVQTPVGGIQSENLVPHVQSARPSPSLRAKARKTTPSSLQTHTPSRRVQRNDDETISDDVVVRHFAPPKTPAQALQSRRMSGGIKRYSDTEN